MNSLTSPPLRAASLTVLGVIASLAAVSASAQARPSIANLQARIADLEANNVPNLVGYLAMDLSDPGKPTLRVAGANLQIVNGLGSTDTVNGVGNLILGYDESRGSGDFYCSLGQYTNETTCTTNGGTWSTNHKSGSHNAVIGAQQNYSRYGGLVAGAVNTINGVGAAVGGGSFNAASGDYASVGGGNSQLASGAYSSVSGGFFHIATGTYDWRAGTLFQDQ